MVKRILGIDNGLSGALAYYDENELIIYDMPIFQIKKRKVLDTQAIKTILINDMPDFCIFEKLTPLPRISGVTCFSMGHSEGIIIALLTALDIPYSHVRPVQWKKAMQCPKDKDGARMRASQLLPKHSDKWPLKKHDGRAEAALIALYGYSQQIT